MNVFTKMKFLAMCLLLATGGTTLRAQQTATFASTDNFALSALYGPMYVTTAANQKSRHAYIYLGSDAAPSGQLSLGSTITALSFLRSGASVAPLTGNVNFKLYLANTTATDLTANLISWSASTTGATLVLSLIHI
jgi:hypothetical protein